MAAATRSIDAPERAGAVIAVPLAADTTVYAGTLVCLNADGNAVPGANTAGLHALGRAEEDADNDGGNAGDITVRVKRGTFRYANSATAAIEAADRGKVCFVEDDSTVAELTTNSVVAGRVVEVDADGVWVDITAAQRSLAPVAVALASTNGTAAAAADLAALKAETEHIGDDVRALKAALVTAGVLS